MSLPRIYLSSLALTMLVAIAVNIWYVDRVAETIRSQIGEAAFQVSKSTVESMLEQNIRFRSLRFGSDSIAAQTRDNIVITGQQQFNLSPGESSGRIEFEVQQPIVETVDLKLTNQQTSRSIVLSRGQQNFDIPIPRTALENTIYNAKNEIIVSSLIIFGIALVFYYGLTQKISKPLQRISRVSEQIGRGNFDEQVTQPGGLAGSELTRLVNSINKMSGQLQQLERQKALLQEQQSTSEISEIARGLAHSVRNPLHTITLAMELLPDAGKKDQQTKSIIRDQVELIDRHIANLMVVTTHERLQDENVEINAMVSSIVNQVSKQAANIKTEISVDQPISIVGQSSELYTILHCVINNAFEACADEQNALVKIDIEYHAGNVSIMVCDSGPGLTDKIKQRLFQPHVTDKAHGAGMGLYIARKLARGRYQGNVKLVDSDHGCCFAITLANRLETL